MSNTPSKGELPFAHDTGEGELPFAPTYVNPIILPKDLPEIKAETFEPVDRKYLRLIYYRSAIFFVIASACLAGLLLIKEGEWPIALTWIIAIAIVLAVALNMVISTLSFPYRGYPIRDKDISYKRGLITFTLTTIPFTRVQHVELDQGILAKSMRLATIKVYTAGSSTGDLSIPGLPVDIAQQIRSYLTDKISTADEI